MLLFTYIEHVIIIWAVGSDAFSESRDWIAI